VDQLERRLPSPRRPLFHNLRSPPPLSLSLSLSSCLDLSAYFLLSLSFFPSLLSDPPLFLRVRCNHRMHGIYRGLNRPFFAREDQRGTSRGISFCLVLRKEEVVAKREKKRKGQKGRVVGLLGALVKSGEINSLRERRQS